MENMYNLFRKMHFFSEKFPYTICIQYELCLLISCQSPWDHNLSYLLQSSPSDCCRTHWPLASRTQGCSQIYCKGRMLSPETKIFFELNQVTGVKAHLIFLCHPICGWGCCIIRLLLTGRRTRTSLFRTNKARHLPVYALVVRSCGSSGILRLCLFATWWSQVASSWDVELVRLWVLVEKLGVETATRVGKRFEETESGALLESCD